MLNEKKQAKCHLLSLCSSSGRYFQVAQCCVIAHVGN